ncbi:NUDIX hydrolase [Micromonospora sp. NPDC003197]
MTTFTPRRAARVLLVDRTDRVLLFRGFDPARPDHRYWFTPGGGLDGAEAPAIGAARELAEETGLLLDPGELGEPVWQQTIEFSFDGRWYRQEQVFFLVRVQDWEVDTTGFTEIERASVDDHRWWTLGELARTAERVYPEDLTAILRGAMDGAASAEAGARTEAAVPAEAGAHVEAGGAHVEAGGARVEANGARVEAARADLGVRVGREGEERC